MSCSEGEFAAILDVESSKWIYDCCRCRDYSLGWMCSVVNCGAVWRCCTRRNPMLESGTFFERPRPQNG
jgi:hypothetical protein